jgi:hypothetical protein
MASELGGSAERVGAAIELVSVLFVGALEDVLAGTLAEAAEGTSFACAGFGRGAAGVGRAGEGGVSGSDVFLWGTSAGVDDWPESLLLSGAVSVETEGAAVGDRSS